MYQYLFQLSFIWLACWLLYISTLKREKFFQLNRFYLLFSLLLGLVIPFIEVPVLDHHATTSDWFAQPVIWLQAITIHAQPALQTTVSWQWADALPLLYMIISAVFLIRLVYQIRHILIKIKTGEQHWENDICWVYTDENYAAYSWMSYLFWSKNRPRHTDEAMAVIAHEQAHIRQKHSWDILYLELLGLFFWWHPLWYIFRRELVDVHEYLADDASLKSISTQAYGQLLLQQHLKRPVLSLAQHFNSSHLKKRIIMMTKSPSKNSAQLKYLLLLPLALVLVLACDETEQNLKETAAAVEGNDIFFERVDTVTVFDPSDQSEQVSIIKTKIYNEPEHMPIFGTCEVTGIEERKACSDRNLLTYIYTHVKYPKAASEAGQEGTVLMSIIISKSGRVDYVELVKDKTTEHDALNEEALRVVRQLPDFEPGVYEGKPVNVKMVLPIKFMLE